MSEDEESSSKYTHEQKIVAAVWVHEKNYNDQTWKDIETNFLIRFNLSPPNRSTLMNWEKKLFTAGNVEDRGKSGRPLSRLMHVPYVKASINESPELSLRERAKVLGLPRTTLLKILREDLNMEFDVIDDGNIKRKHAPSSGGRWKNRNESAASSTATN